MEENSEIRKHKDTLIIVGKGVVAFGLWSIIKSIAYSFLEKDEFFKFMNEAVGEIEALEPEIGRLFVYAFSVIFFIIVYSLLSCDIVFRIYVAKSAGAEAFGTLKKKRNTYLVIAGFMAFMSLLSILRVPFTIFKGEFEEAEDIIDIIATTIVELTSFITLTELMVSAVKIRRLRAGLEQQNTGERG